jgi:hypothetical protein
MLHTLRLICATWRLSSLIAQERGPDNVLGKLRQHYQGTEVGEWLGCIWCNSLWIAPVVWWLDKHHPEIIDLLVLSTGAIALDKHISS